MCGVIAVMLAATDNLVAAAFFVVLGIFFDFFDGFAARLLKVQSDLGVQLDSLADMVTSGVVPGVVMFQLLHKSLGDWTENNLFDSFSSEVTGTMYWVGGKIETIQLLSFVGLLLTLGACYRLANFNIDTRQTDSFIGLPTPAMTLFVISLPLIHTYSDNQMVIDFINNKWFLIAITLLLTFLMNAELPLFSLKLKNFSFQKNWIQILFLIISLVLLITLQFVAIPLIIVFYIILSLFVK